MNIMKRQIQICMRVWRHGYRLSLHLLFEIRSCDLLHALHWRTMPAPALNACAFMTSCFLMFTIDFSSVMKLNVHIRIEQKHKPTQVLAVFCSVLSMQCQSNIQFSPSQNEIWIVFLEWTQKQHWDPRYSRWLPLLLVVSWVYQCIYPLLESTRQRDFSKVNFLNSCLRKSRTVEKAHPLFVIRWLQSKLIRYFTHQMKTCSGLLSTAAPFRTMCTI